LRQRRPPERKRQREERNARSFHESAAPRFWSAKC
jgi:hypothetical protein